MNHIQPHAFSSAVLALPDAPRVAQEAIFRHDQPRLLQLLHAQEVNANTRSADGGTLLTEAIRCLNARAFAALAPESEMIEINTADADGNTVMHHLALRMTDDVLDDVWEEVLTSFLEQREPDIDWDLINRDGQRALDLVAMGECDRFDELLDPYAPGTPRSSRSSHCDSYTDEEVFSDVDSVHFENLSSQQQARVMSMFERFLQQKRGR